VAGKARYRVDLAVDFMLFYITSPMGQCPLDIQEGVQEVCAVLIAFEDDLSLVAARRDRTDSAGIFNSQRTRHTLRITEENRDV